MVPSDLEIVAKKIRREVIEMIFQAGSGHPGGSLSSTDILVALCLGGILKEEDHFILSCGHVCPAYYAVLAEKGIVRPEELKTLRNLGSRLQGHPSSLHADFVRASTGSLGQGLSVGIGMALAKKFKVVVLSSDGEQDEGSHWEAVMFAAHHQLGNLNLVIDQNGMQIGGQTTTVLNTQPLIDKYRAFGWEAYEVDGHNYNELLPTLGKINEASSQPKVIICRTIRGKGVSFMEGSPKYHACTLSEEEYKKAMEELV